MAKSVISGKDDSRSLSALSASCIVLLLLLSALFASCKKSDPVPPVNPEAHSYSEPESYSATLVRTLEEDDRREETISRIARLGELYREEWIEKGERRAIISRPDLGKSFLLSIDKKIYIESAINPDLQSVENKSETSKEAEEIDRAFQSTALPVESETLALPDRAVEGHSCQVTEHRARFADGSVEITRHFRARDLGGLALRVEQQSQTSTRRTSLVTERRDVRTEVAREVFEIPSDFRKVDVISNR